MADIIFHNKGETRDSQTRGGGRSHEADIEGVRIERIDGKLRIIGLKKRGPTVSPLAGCFLEIPRDDRDALEAISGVLSYCIASPHAPDEKKRRARKKVAS
ncbi:MAG: hypothetical protein OES69_14595 [Myxococcales bacterium]|nr:hypothetical protein [Myxococcales bacterium]